MMDPKSYGLRNAVHDWEEGEKRYNRVFRISPEHVKVGYHRGWWVWVD